jgi:hypothetical protein
MAVCVSRRKGAQHGRFKMKIKRSEEKIFILKHILGRMTICNRMGCIDIRTGAVRQFQLVNNCLKMALLRPKHVAIKCDFDDILK